jgi:hypothetical protein
MPYKGSAKSLNEFVYRLDFALGGLAVGQSPGALPTKRHREELSQGEFAFLAIRCNADRPRFREPALLITAP